MMLSTKDLVFKERLARKLVDHYVGPYIIDKVVSTNVVKLQLSISMRIHPVVNVSQIVQYKKQVEGQKRKEVKPVEVNRVEKWEVEKILNKRKVRGVVKYLVQWKGFTVEYDSWEKEEDLENVKKIVVEFEERMNVEVRRQEKLERVEEKNFRREELLRKYMAKILHR